MLIRSFLLTVALFLLSVSALAVPLSALNDQLGLASGEALFHASQNKWFDAIARLDRELSPLDKKTVKNSNNHNATEAASLGYQLSYRLNQRDSQAIQGRIAKVRDDKVRNALFYRLAELHFRNGELGSAQAMLDRIQGEMTLEVENDRDYLSAQLLLEKDAFRDAITILRELSKEQRYLGFAGFNRRAQNLLGFSGYNLGIAHLMSGNKEEGLLQLDLAGQISGSDDETTLSLRDKANLVLGEELFKAGQYVEAGAILDRVRLDGPFSSRALLNAGWASAMEDDFKRALVPWTLLSERNVADTAVQEALLAVPYSYGKLGVYTKSGVLYGQAIEIFDTEIIKLKSSIKSVQEGLFLEALLREEMKLDPDWVVRLREYPEMPETFYLVDLIATRLFQNDLANYTDLGRLRKKLIRWQQDLQAYEDLVQKRRKHYEPLLPKIDAEFSKLDSEKIKLLKQRSVIQKKLKVIQSRPRPMMLATVAERKVLKQIKQVDSLLRPYHTVKSKARIKRLRGVTKWPVYIGYEERIASTRDKLQQLVGMLNELEQKFSHFSFLREATTASFTGYDQQIKELRQRINTELEKTESTMAEQGALLTNKVETELVHRLDKLKEMQIKARFAMADSFDRAATLQGSGKGAR